MSLKIDLETKFAEYVIDIGKVTLGTEQRLRMNPLLREKQAEAICQAICALLNSGGGVIKAEIENEEYHYESHGVGMHLPFSDYLDQMQQGKLFLIYVKSWNTEATGLRLATLCSNLYQRLGPSGIVVMDSQEALAFLRRKTQTPMNNPDHNSLSLPEAGAGEQDEGDMRNLANTLFRSRQLQYLEKLNFTESMHVEFQMFTTDMLQHIKETLPKYVSAFANTEGGYIFFGVHDRSCQVIGCEKEKLNLVTLRESIDSCIKRLPVHHFCTQNHKIQYDLKFLEVLDKRILHGYVLAIKVDQFCCAAFAQLPSSWQVKDNLVRQLTAKEWATWMVEADPGQGSRPKLIAIFAREGLGREEREVWNSLQLGKRDSFLSCRCLTLIPRAGPFPFLSSSHLEYSAFSRYPEVGAGVRVSLIELFLLSCPFLCLNENLFQTTKFNLVFHELCTHIQMCLLTFCHFCLTSYSCLVFCIEYSLHNSILLCFTF